jgi:hypothetical protein
VQNSLPQIDKYDLLNEDRLTLHDLAREIEKDPSTIWRWQLKGVRGVRLETFCIGASRYTTRQAFRRFQERCTAAADGASCLSPTPEQASHEQRVARAESELARLGV